jgi:hypothetical protein
VLGERPDADETAPGRMSWPCFTGRFPQDLGGRRPAGGARQSGPETSRRHHVSSTDGPAATAVAGLN